MIHYQTISISQTCFRKALVPVVALILIALAIDSAAAIRIKEISRIAGVHENSLVGYGLVVGLSGTGDTGRSRSTTQSVGNALKNFGVNVSDEDISSRNVAAVMITAKLPAFAEVGGRIDVNASSLGDARSLTGGTLLMAPLRGADNNVYALAQGAISVGGYRYDYNGNLIQKNHPTVGTIPMGATIERRIESSVLASGRVSIILNDADYLTASRVEEAINQSLNGKFATAVHAGKVDVVLPGESVSPVRFISNLQNLEIEPDSIAKVVVNERTGTVVAGGDIRIDDVTISHANVKVTIATKYSVSQPQFLELVGRGNDGVETRVIANSDLKVQEDDGASVTLKSGATIEELVISLQKVRISTRDIITVLQALKSAGALHAELVVQ